MLYAAPCVDREIEDIRTELAKIAAVKSVHFKFVDPIMHIFVGLSDDSMEIRSAVYEVEDRVSAKFRDIRFDFRVIPVPEGRMMEDFVSTAKRVFLRNAA